MTARLPLSPDEIRAAIAAEGGSVTRAAERLGCCRSSLYLHLRAAERAQGLADAGVEVEPVPSADLPLDELLARRCADYERRQTAQDAARVRTIRIRQPGPIAIVHVGDPHLDDPGCDLPQLRADLAVVDRTEGMFAGCLGDLTNNWIGRLEKLYAEQPTTAREAWRLAEWMLGACPWLYVLRGNHDQWSGPRDPLDYLIGAALVGVDAAHGVTMEVAGPGWKRPLRIAARHDYPGHSMWNRTHAAGRAAQLDGAAADVYLHGHRHSWGYRAEEGPDGRVWHAIAVGSYKRGDDYAAAKGLRESRHGAAAVTVIRPDVEGPGRITVLWSVEEAADLLGWARARGAA